MLFLAAGLALAGPAAGEPLVLGPYEGVLPCADCPGIRTELTLRRKAAGWAEGTYRLVETYLDRGSPQVTQGEWTTLRGDAVNEDAVVYELNPDKPDRARHFERVDDKTVSALGRDLAPPPKDTPAMLTLKTKKKRRQASP
jgi:uncharacterized lipoprotein NlpE involved in copper resistance